jgi:hypothetical protein
MVSPEPVAEVVSPEKVNITHVTPPQVLRSADNSAQSSALTPLALLPGLDLCGWHDVNENSQSLLSQSNLVSPQAHAGSLLSSGVFSPATNAVGRLGVPMDRGLSPPCSSSKREFSETSSPSERRTTAVASLHLEGDVTSQQNHSRVNPPVAANTS